MFKIILSFLFIMLPYFAKGQISSVNQTNPTPNSTIEIRYNPFAKKAKFSINDDVFAIIRQFDQNGNVRLTYKEMSRNKNILSCDINVNDSAAFYVIQFITLSQNSWDMQAYLSFMIYGQNGEPVRNAHCSNMQTNNYKKEGEAELKLYHDNYAVYGNLWYKYKYQKPGQYKTLISEDLLNLEKVSKVSACLLYTKAYGYILLHKYKKALGLAKELISRYPKNYYTSSTLSSFLDELHSTNNEGKYYQQIKNMTDKYAINNDELSSVWNMIEKKSFSVFSDSCIQKVCKHRITLQPDNPSSYYLEGIIYNKKSKLSEAEQSCQKAISLILQGKLRLYSDISGKMSSIYLVGLYATLAEIEYKQNKFGEALAAIKASQTIMSNPYDKTFQVEGNIWFKLKNYVNAEQAYFEALKSGLSEAKNDIQKCYEITHNNINGFDSYLTEKLNNSDNDKKDKENIAPDFHLKDMNNVNYSLEKLRGKIIVMNFWFTGCAPCREEIPVLNDLVSKYGKKDVVFLGFALDDDMKRLHSYLKEYPFKYVIIPKATKVAENYKIRYYPTQVIINKQGRIVTKLVGGSNKALDEIPTIIDNQLRN